QQSIKHIFSGKDSSIPLPLRADARGRGRFSIVTHPSPLPASPFWWGRPRVGVVKPLGCYDRSAATLARRALPAYRPGSLPGAFRPNGLGSLVSERASRLDAFSAYPVPTWLPCGAVSTTAGTPAVGPPQSSRTRGDPPQASHAHGR